MLVEFQSVVLVHSFFFNVSVRLQLAGRPALAGSGEALQATSSAAERFPSVQRVAATTTIQYQVDPKMFSCIPDISGSDSES